MGLINNKDTQSNTGVNHNVIASESTIKGNITAASDIRIDGTVEGNIDCKGRVVIGPSGNVQGNITCSSAEIMGVLNGDITVAETLSLKSTATLNGEVQTTTLVIEPGANFTGSCSMGGGLKVNTTEQNNEN